MRTLALPALFTVAVAVFASGSLPRVGAAPVPKQKADNPDLAALQGKWKLTGLSIEDAAFSAKAVERYGAKLEFQGDKAIFTQPGNRTRTLATVQFDLKAKPRRIMFTDRKATDLNDKPVELPEGAWDAMIYKIGSDELVMAGFTVNVERNGKVPDDFVGKPGSDTRTLTFKKEK